jgi:hypothetical protein
MDGHHVVGWPWTTRSMSALLARSRPNDRLTGKATVYSCTLFHVCALTMFVVIRIRTHYSIAGAA